MAEFLSEKLRWSKTKKRSENNLNALEYTPNGVDSQVEKPERFQSNGAGSVDRGVSR
ncbi:MAG: hypothetical protein AAGA87_15650 [Pseudomonadota bacterium]